MNKTSHIYKPFSTNDIEFIGGQIHKNIIPYFLITVMISIFEIVMIIRGFLVFNFEKSHHVLYFISYCFLLTVSIVLLLLILFHKKFKKPSLLYYNLGWIYSLALFAWGFLVSGIDMLGGHSPIVYLTVMITISGIALINPIIYNSLSIPTVILLFSMNGVHHFLALTTIGDYFNVCIFMIMATIMNFRLYRVSQDNYIEKKKLEIITITDSLTGLGNETKYLNTVHRIEDAIKEGNHAKFKLAMLDVNNLKATNDLYGHRFGCNLIVQAGHILPSVFPHSDIFHVGGDEFIVIAEEGKDYDNFDNLLNVFKEELEYRKILYSDVELVLSLAIGHATYEKGMKYSDVLQIADHNMYENKKQVKAKYHFASR